MPYAYHTQQKFATLYSCFLLARLMRNIITSSHITSRHINPPDTPQSGAGGPAMLIRAAPSGLRTGSRAGFPACFPASGGFLGTGTGGAGVGICTDAFGTPCPERRGVLDRSPTSL